jgi:hypothetical protein
MGVDSEAEGAEARKNRIKPPLTHDRAHAPLLGYASFLLTGDVWAQEELAAEAAYCFHDWPHDGRFRYPGTRVFAWSLRTTMLAAKVLPDADPMKKYLGERLRANLAEVRGITQSPHPLHLWDNGGWEASARKSWVCATQASPWQLAWVAPLPTGPRGCTRATAARRAPTRATPTGSRATTRAYPTSHPPSPRPTARRSRGAAATTASPIRSRPRPTRPSAPAPSGA